MPPVHGIEKKFRLVIGLHVVALDQVLDLRADFFLISGRLELRKGLERRIGPDLDGCFYSVIITGIKIPGKQKGNGLERRICRKVGKHTTHFCIAEVVNLNSLAHRILIPE